MHPRHLRTALLAAVWLGALGWGLWVTGAVAGGADVVVARAFVGSGLSGLPLLASSVVLAAALAWLTLFRPVRLRGLGAVGSVLGVLLAGGAVGGAGWFLGDAFPGEGPLVAGALGAAAGFGTVAVRPRGIQPRRGGYWMAWVPFEDDPSRGKDRPCLVVGGTRRRLRVLYVTSQPQHGRHGYVALTSSTTWPGRVAAKQSWMRVSRHDGAEVTIPVPRSRFRRHLGRWTSAERTAVRRGGGA